MPSKPTILLIDYDPKSIQDTLEPLTRAGYRVEVAGDGQSGLEVFGKLAPDLVLIEPMVPKKHGFQVCHEIKSTPRGKSTPVLITTAFYRGRKHRIEAQEKYGCDGYLEKPISEELLLSTCRKFLIDTDSPPLPVERSLPSAAPVGRAPERAGSVISFPELPLTEDPKPTRLVALDDLSDEEIQARLDHMILEDETQPASAGPAPGPGSLEARGPGLARRDHEAPTRSSAPDPIPAAPAAADPAPRPGGRPGGPTGTPDEVRAGFESIAPPVPLARAEPLAGSTEPAIRRGARSARPRRREQDERASRDTVAPTRAPSRLPMWIGVAAVACVLAGAALLWSLREPAGDTDVTTASLAAVTEDRPAIPAAPAAPSVENPATPDREARSRGSEPSRAGSDRATGPAPAAARPPIGPARGDGPAPSGVLPPESQPQTRGASAPAEPRVPVPPRAAPPLRAEPAPEAAPPAVADPALAGENRPSRDEPAPAVASPAAPLVPGDDPPAAVRSAEPVVAAPEAPRTSRGDLIALGDVDVPPRALNKPAPEYPRAASQLRQEGTVNLRVLVDENGRVERAEIESGTKLRVLQNQALRAAEGWTYEPATKDGVRVKVWITEAVTFEL